MNHGPGRAALEQVQGPSEGGDEQDRTGSPEAGIQTVVSSWVREGTDLAKSGAAAMGITE